MDQREFARAGQAATARRKRLAAIGQATPIIEALFLRNPTMEDSKVVGALKRKARWSESKARRVWQWVKETRSFAGE